MSNRKEIIRCIEGEIEYSLETFEEWDYDGMNCYTCDNFVPEEDTINKLTLNVLKQPTFQKRLNQLKSLHDVVIVEIVNNIKWWDKSIAGRTKPEIMFPMIGDKGIMGEQGEEFYYPMSPINFKLGVQPL